MSTEQAIDLIRTRADTYERNWSVEKDMITPCPHRFCGALVPFYAIDRILRSIADEIERAP